MSIPIGLRVLFRPSDDDRLFPGIVTNCIGNDICDLVVFRDEIPSFHPRVPRSKGKIDQGEYDIDPDQAASMKAAVALPVMMRFMLKEKPTEGDREILAELAADVLDGESEALSRYLSLRGANQSPTTNALQQIRDIGEKIARLQEKTERIHPLGPSGTVVLPQDIHFNPQALENWIPRIPYNIEVAIHQLAERVTKLEKALAKLEEFVGI